MATFNPIDQSKLHYKFLGWGVDCRKPEHEWQESLQRYDGHQIRDLAIDDRNIHVIPISEVMSIEEIRIKSTSGGLGGGMGASSFNINASFGIQVTVKKVSKEQTNTKYQLTRTATLPSHICYDPNTITLESNKKEDQYSLFEQVLSNYILEFIERKQIDSDSHHGKKIRDLQGENPITKLDDYTNDPKCQWKLIADACTSFVEEYGYTHYVYSITLGTQEEEKLHSWDSPQQLSGNVGGGGEIRSKDIKAEGKVGLEHSMEGKYEQKHTKGEAANNTVTTEEVINWHMKPVSSLINDKSQNLKHIMESLLKRYAEIKRGKLKSRMSNAYSLVNIQ